MDKQEKDFIINKGFLLGLILLFFPLLDLTSGSKMSNTNYFIIFGLLWMILYSYLINKKTKIVSSDNEYFLFKDTFRTLFLISAIAFGVLTVGKTLLWTVSFPEKYIEINEYRELSYFNIQKSVIDEAYQNGTFSDEQYEEQMLSLNNNKILLEEKWNMIKSEGIGATYFFQMLISVLFLISVYCLILASIIRKKEPLTIN